MKIQHTFGLKCGSWSLLYVFVSNIAKHMKIFHIRTSSGKHLLRCLGTEKLGSTTIDDIERSCCSLCPEFTIQLATMQHGSVHFHNCPISAFHYSILFCCIRTGELPSNPMFTTKYIKLFGAELSPTIWTYGFNHWFGVTEGNNLTYWSCRLLLHHPHECRNMYRGFWRVTQEVNPLLRSSHLQSEEAP